LCRPTGGMKRWAVPTLRIFPVDYAFVDLLEPQPRVHRQRRRVLLHGLRFDEQDAAVAEPLKSLAEQERGETLAAMVRRHMQVEHAGGWASPGSGKRLDVPEPNVGQRFRTARASEQKTNPLKGAGRACFPPVTNWRRRNLLADHFASKLSLVACDRRAKGR